MNKLLAPNGKKSNLTPEQYKLVRTKAFKDWFGDWENDPQNASKVVDENGEPLVMYHGTPYRKFHIFEGNKWEDDDDWKYKKTFWFTTDLQLANYHSKKQGGKGNLFECFLDIKNPKLKDSNLYKYEDFDGYIDYKGSWDDLEEYKRSLSINNAVTTESTQIKLADGSNTTFDPNDEDIRYAKGGKIDSLIEQGVVDLKMYDTKPEHAEIYGLESSSPLFIKSISFIGIERNKAVAENVFEYIDEYAKANNHDLIFGHIEEKSEPNLKAIKSMLKKAGYTTIEGYDDFYKYVETKKQFAKGGRTVAQTPAPAKDRIYGSKFNKKGSASSESKASSIKLSESIISVLEDKMQEHNSEYPNKKVSLAVLKAVFRRGAGAYSSSHRPTISGGKPNSRTAWAYARVNRFLEKKAGKQVKKAYVQDDDLIGKYHLGGDMSKHLAPNGKPSNLTHEQWHLVRTPEFKAWFGDWENDPQNASKVVDDNGEPLVVYHGTNYQFNEFKTTRSRSGEGAYFSKDKNTALGYQDPYTKGSSINSYFVKLINPFIHKESIVGYVQEKKREYDGEIGYGWRGIKNYEVVAYYANQIKLADGTNTTFDGGNPDIRFAKGGEVGSSTKFMKWWLEWYKPISDKMSIYISFPIDSTEFAETNVVILNLFEKIDQEIDAKPYLNEIVKKADEYGTTIYLNPTPRYKQFSKDSSKGRKVTKNYLIEYYKRFGFKLTDGDFMKRLPSKKYHLGGDMSKHLAPNGKPSNLTHEQWHLVRTPEFKAWFGDWENDPENASKVVDDNGEPLVVYHFSDLDFNVFEIKGISNGFFFTENKKDNEFSKISVLELLNKGEYPNWIKKLMEQGLSIEKIIENVNESKYEKVKSYFLNLKKMYPLSWVGEVSDNNWSVPYFENLYIDKARERGFNGIEFIRESDKKRIIVAFEPNQIKLADGTNTTFDGSNPDIRFADGGMIKKKAYVSIRLPFDVEQTKVLEYKYTYNDLPFKELASGTLDGVLGVSSSRNNIAEWFVSRDCLIVMDYEQFEAINNTEVIEYDNPTQLLRDKAKLFRRLYNNLRKSEELDKYVIKQTYTKIGAKIVPEINLEMKLADGQKYSELYRISQFLNPSITSSFYEYVVENDLPINSPEDFTNAILTFNKMDNSYLGKGYENQFLAFDELLPIVAKGITFASKIFESEQEVIMLNRKLNIPENSQLFFIKKQNESNLTQLIDEYNLSDKYRINFVQQKDLDRFRTKFWEKEQVRFEEKKSSGIAKLEIKKNEVLANLLDYFINFSLNSVYDILNKEYGDDTFNDRNSDDYEEYKWVHIPFVVEILSEYKSIVTKCWNDVFSGKDIKGVNLYSFMAFEDDAKRRLTQYFEQNRERFNSFSYRGNSGYFYATNLEYPMLQSVNDYQNSPEWIDYKELGMMYLKQMGSDIYRYFNEDEIYLKSKYEKGGLIAPNGNKSKLTPEQYKLVRTPEFKAWFGDWENDPQNASKVVDDNGEPLVVYHGSRKAGFGVFDNTIGQNRQSDSPDGTTFFTKDISVAHTYSGTYDSVVFDEDRKEKAKEDAIKNDEYYDGWEDNYDYSIDLERESGIYKVFLNIREPYEEDFDGANWDGSAIGKFELSDSDGIRVYDNKGHFLFETREEAEAVADAQGLENYEIYEDVWIGTTTNDVAKEISKYNDGCIIYNVTDDGSQGGYGGETTIYITGSPNQIKMADGSNTKFDMNNPDVRYAKGGKVIAYKTDEAKFKKIGITDKYTIEAINEIGLQGLKFNAETVNKKIEDAFLELLGETKNDKFLISEDSEAITKVIQREIDTRYEQGDTDENIARFKSFLENSFERMRFVKQYAETQKQTISEWANYFSHSEYPIPFKYLMLKAVTGYNYDYKLNELIKRSNKTTRNFTPFDAGSLAELYASNSDNLLKDFTQIEANNANKIANQKLLLQTSSGGKWLKFNGGTNTPEEEKIQNSKELSKLVQNTYWCTKTNSKSQLDDGDFYVYVTQSLEGEPLPRIAVRMEGDKVAEVRGNKSGAQDIEDEMLPIAEDFLKNNIENNSGKKWLDSIKFNKKAVALFNKLQDGLFKGAVEEFAYLAGKEQQFLLEYANRNGHIFRIENLIKIYLDKPNKFYGKNEVKFLTPNYYGEPNYYELDNDTRILIGDVTFSANVDSTKNIEIISGITNFKYSAITNLGKIKLIGDVADFRDSDVNDLGDLSEIGGTAYFNDSDIRNLSNLERIGKDVVFYDSDIQNLGKLAEIGGNAYFQDTTLTSLFELTYIGGKADFRGSKITDLGNLKFVGENLVIRNSEIVNLGNLEYIGGEVYFAKSQVFDLGKLKHIGGDAWFENSQIMSLKNLEYIGGMGFFTNSKVTNLGNLKKIMGNADFDNSQITNLENLEYIGGDANFNDSLITSLGNLEYIGGNATFVDSLLTNLGKLKYVRKDAFFTWSKITDIGNLKVGGHIHGLKQKFEKGGEIADLVVLHNINAGQIKQADKLGGLVTPSIAILKANESFTDFGSITLIGTKELIDPENRDVKVFAGDVYSPSVPQKLYYIDKSKLNKVETQLIKKSYEYDKEIFNLVQRYIGDYSGFERELNQRSLDDLIYSYEDKLKVVYLVDKGIKIKVPMKEKRHFLWNNFEFSLTPEQKKRFAPILKKYSEESNEKGSAGISEETQSAVYDLLLEVLQSYKDEYKAKYEKLEDGQKLYSIMTDGLDKSFERYVGTRYSFRGNAEYDLSRAVYGEQVVDVNKLEKNINREFTTAVKKDYQEWLKDFITQFRGSAYFLKGKEKMPYTLNYLVDATSSSVRGQESNLTFGVNQAKSYGIKQFKSIKQIKDNSNKLISKADMDLIDEQNRNEFFDIAHQLNYDGGWGKLDSFGRAIADYYKGYSMASALRKNDFKAPSKSMLELSEQFADKVKNSPVDYFEAKYQRAVNLSEFNYAIVPQDTDKETISILRKNNLTVKKYKDYEDRNRIKNEIVDKNKKLRFEKGGSLLDTKIEKTPLKGKTLSDVYDLPELYELAEKYKMGLDTIRKEYLKGIEVEREHTNDYGLSAQIALNHLNEDAKYYTKLKKAKLERGGKVLKITKFTPITFNN